MLVMDANLGEQVYYIFSVRLVSCILFGARLGSGLDICGVTQDRGRAKLTRAERRRIREYWIKKSRIARLV